MLKKARMLNAACGSALALAASLSASAALAQEATASPVVEDQAAQVDDIIVTAQKRSERLQDVPLSITAATGAELLELNVTTAEGLAKITPGFTALTTGSGTPVYTIRGIGFIDVSVAGAPAVSVYVDQVPLPFALMAPGATLDLERVEVLKGPQGTLFGQNSTGGAVNYIAAKPTETFEAGADVTYGRFDQFDVNAFVSGPISDTLGFRAAIRSEQRGDWQESYTRDDSLGQRDFLAGRLLLDWTPSERLRFSLNLNGWRDQSDTIAQQFQAYQATNPAGYPEPGAALRPYPVAPEDARAADWDVGADLSRDNSFYQASLRTDWDLTDTITLSSITAFMRYEADFLSDADGTSFNNFLTDVTGTVETWTQELRLAGTTDRTTWMIGGNFESDEARERDELFLNGTNSGVGPFRYGRAFLDNNQDIETAAIFGSLDFDLTETLTAQGSVRYTDQTRDFEGCLRDPGDGRIAAALGFLATNLSGRPVTIAPGSCDTLADDSPTPLPIVASTLAEDNVSWRVGLNWKPEPDSLIYATVAQGYKVGGYSTLPGVRAAQFDPATQEGVLAYEVGVKTALAEGTVRLDAALFYYEYSDKQIRGFVNTGVPFGNLPTLVNIPESTVQGAEVNVSLFPTEGLTITGGVSYVDSEVGGSFLVNDQTGLIVDAGGEAFPSAPKWQLNGDISYEAPVWAGWTGFVGAHVNHRTETTAFLGGNPFFDIDGYTLLDLRVGVESDDGRWRVQAFGDNVTDEYYVNNVTRPIDAFARIAGMPRTYGLRVGYRY